MPAAPDYDPAAIRRWARERGDTRPLPGRYLPTDLVQAYREAHRGEGT